MGATSVQDIAKAPVAATEIGVIGGRSTFGVSEAGVVQISDGVVIEWWVGAEDRWHRVSGEAAVRQALGDDGVTIETRCKVPGGDVVHRVAAVPSSGAVLARVDIENATPVPVAIAAVVRCHGRPAAIQIGEDSLAVAGQPVLRAGRSIARLLIAEDLADAIARVDAGDAVPPAALGGELVGAVAVAIFPVPHTATLRLTLGAGEGGLLPMPDDLPPFDAIARGWEHHFEAGARLGVPDERLTRAVAAARRHLLAAAGDTTDDAWLTEPGWAAPVAAVALDVWGHDGEALDLLLAASGIDDLTVHATRPVEEAAALVWAWAERLERRPDPELAAAVAPMIEELALRLLQRRRRWFGRGSDASADPTQPAWRAVGLAAAASLLSRIGDSTAGGDIVDALGGLGADIDRVAGVVPLALGGRRLGAMAADVPTVVAAAVAHLHGGNGDDRTGNDGALLFLGARATATGAMVDQAGRHARSASALLALGVARAMADEPGGAGGPVAIWPGIPDAWAGATIEFHAMAVTGGTVSCAARWHGTRPALLWEMSVATEPPLLVAPGLDGHWRHEPGDADRSAAGTWKGEALLAPTPGLESAAMESPQVRRGDRLDIAEDPGSFA